MNIYVYMYIYVCMHIYISIDGYTCPSMMDGISLYMYMYTDRSAPHDWSGFPFSCQAAVVS